MSDQSPRITRSIAYFALAWLALCLSSLLLSSTSVAAAGPPPRPFGHACTLEPYGVRFCPTASLSERVPSFDGAPLDVDVTLPATGSGPWPTIVMAQPYGTSKTEYETTDASGSGPWGPGYSNVWFADRGYAVLTYSMRGTGNSCGTAQSRIGYPACGNVEFELADQRYDARDVQWLLGLLVDEGIAKPSALGVTGVSLGSIVSLELDVLYNRIRLADGAFAPWKSPEGVPLHISAVYTNSSIADTLDLAAPNGRFLSFEPATATSDHSPVGVIKTSFPLLTAGASSPGASNIWDTPPAPGDFDFPAGVATAEASQPDSPAVEAFADQLATYHQAVGMPIGTGTAPVLIEDGWDDVVVNGASQAIRMADYLKRAAPHANVALQLADIGHPLSGQKAADFLATFLQATAFLNHYLKGQPGGPAPGSVSAWTVTCPLSAPSAGPYTAQGMDALAPGTVRFSSAAPQSVASGGDPQIGASLDWTRGLAVSGACQTFNAVNWPGTAVYAHPVTRTFTMLGLPTMRFHVNVSGDFGQLDARLWDVAPDGQETFVSRGTYALTNNQQGTVTWQLWGGAHTFAKGDTIRVELLDQDPPTERPSPTPFTVKVSDFTIALPSRSGAPPSTGRRGHKPPGCINATGRLSGAGVGPFRIGMTVSRARGIDAHHRIHGRRHEDFFCLRPIGIRVGYAYNQVLRGLSHAERQRLDGRVVLISTACRRYSLHGIRPATRVSTARRRHVRLGRAIHLGPNTWYVVSDGRNRGIFKVRHGVIEEVGVASGTLTANRPRTRRLLQYLG